MLGSVAALALLGATAGELQVVVLPTPAHHDSEAMRLLATHADSLPCTRARVADSFPSFDPQRCDGACVRGLARRLEADIVLYANTRLIPEVDARIVRLIMADGKSGRLIDIQPFVEVDIIDANPFAATYAIEHHLAATGPIGRAQKLLKRLRSSSALEQLPPLAWRRADGLRRQLATSLDIWQLAHRALQEQSCVVYRQQMRHLDGLVDELAALF